MSGVLPIDYFMNYYDISSPYRQVKPLFGSSGKKSWQRCDTLRDALLFIAANGSTKALEGLAVRPWIKAGKGTPSVPATPSSMFTFVCSRAQFSMYYRYLIICQSILKIV